jgi:methylated-DNA-[protein]-cysteine S-methyltransferase
MMATMEPEARDLLSPLLAQDEQAAARLHARLADAAAAEGILDVAYRTVDTPLGTLLLAATEQGLVRVAYPNQGHDAALTQLAELVSPRILNAPCRLNAVARQLGRVLPGRRRASDAGGPAAVEGSATACSRTPADLYGATESYACGGHRPPACGPSPAPRAPPNRCRSCALSLGGALRLAGLAATPWPDAKRSLLTLRQRDDHGHGNRPLYQTDSRRGLGRRGA